jgi:hypothetical protein
MSEEREILAKEYIYLCKKKDEKGAEQAVLV